MNQGSHPTVSVAIPTYRREKVLLDTVSALSVLRVPPIEILVLDQSENHETATATALEDWARNGKIRWIRLPAPSIPRAMNTGLRQACGEIVLFVDDDIVPGADLVSTHALAHSEGLCNIVAGQVLQPGEQPHSGTDSGEPFRFSSDRRCWIGEFMGGNFSVRRDAALALGGFDENFVDVAYRFEAEFASRAQATGERILFVPDATIRHLKAPAGGTRSYGNHLSTLRPSHAVGAYYYLLRARNVRHRAPKILARLAGSVRTRHHLRRPWWIPVTLAAEIAGFFWAVGLHLRGPRLIALQAPLGGRDG